MKIALTQWDVGLHGDFFHDLPDTTQYYVEFTNDATWPAEGEVFKITAEVKVGDDWVFDASLHMHGGEWQTRQGESTNTSHWQVTLPPSTQIRFNLEVFQPFALGIEFR